MTKKKQYKIGILCSRVRPEEKLLFQEIRMRENVELVQINPDGVVFNLQSQLPELFDVDIVLERCITHSHALYGTKILEDRGLDVVNSYNTIRICGDKLMTSLLLEKANVPTTRVRVTFSEESALRAIEELGYPCVLKPAVGSWGRLISKIENRAAAESIVEHKHILGTYHHSVYYIQEYVEKPGRDIRAFVIDGKCIAAIYRASEHWVTNTARGGKTENCPITPHMQTVCTEASNVVGGGILALDLFETERGLLINEINHTMEFRNSIDPTGVNIPGKIVDYVLQQIER
jgi:[lysine-biosynthesis-protein LysW]--L-2-aminoadipate ligase